MKRNSTQNRQRIHLRIRKKVKGLIAQLAAENPKVPSNMLHALTSIKPSQLMDKNFWDFKQLESERCDDLPLAMHLDEMGAPFG